MSSCTDPLRLNEHELFKELKNGASKNDKETRNILKIRDDTLYVWDAEKYCIHTLNVAACCGKVGESTSYQTLPLTDPPIFEITNLLINETATLLTLWGNLGVVVVELPRRWGKDNAFHGGKGPISCVNYNLSGRHSQLAACEIRRVRWHPGSSSDSHLLILTSANVFQLYDCELGSAPKLIRTWEIGPAPSSSPNKKIPTIESLGETGVDFDFITPTIKIDYDNKRDCDNYNWNEIEWRILVLRGDGNVLIVHGNILSNHVRKPVTIGTLSIYPQTVDNYGVESCSLMCIQTTPPIVIIATTTGVIYHAILLRNFNDNDDNDDSQEIISKNIDDSGRTWPENGSSCYLNTSNDALFVFESLEMELGLLYTDNDNKYKCPIHLHRDRENKSRYFCSHNAGIHMITLPIVSELTQLVNHPEESFHLYSQTKFSSSNSQYLVCTRTKHTKKGDGTPVLGFGLLQQPCPVLIALLHSGIIVDLPVIDLNYLSRIEPIQTTMSPSKKTNREPFDNYIKNILKQESTSQPITKLAIDTKLTGRECFQLLDRATNIFRSHYFVKHDRARGAIEKKVRALKALKNHQLKELSQLMELKLELQERAQSLAERYEDIKEKQEELARRAEEVLRLVNYKELSSAERTDAAELTELDEKIHKLDIRFNQLNEMKKEQSGRIETHIRNEEKKEMVLSTNQEKIIKSNLTEMSQSIATMINQVKMIERDLGI